MKFDAKYSNKDMTGWDLSDRKDMSGINIQGLCLSWEVPDAHALPVNLVGTTFVGCNLDNVWVPSGNTLVNCSNRRFKVQNDGEDWEIHPVTKTALVPLNKQSFIDLGLSIDPKDIPIAKQDISVTQKARNDKELASQTIAAQVEVGVLLP